MLRFDLVLAACALTNAASLGAAALALHWQRPHSAGPRWPSFAVGVLLGVVLLDLLPDLWEATGQLPALLGLFGAALIVSLVLDRACACGHFPTAGNAAEDGHDHQAPQGRATRGSELLVLGDFLHSFIDGSLIAATLAVGIVPGAVTTIAVATHEAPRRIVVVTLLMRAGYQPVRAFMLALCAATGTVVGGAVGWSAAQALRPAMPIALAFSAAALLYVASVQSRGLLHRWGAHVLTLDCALPFLFGLFVVGGSRHVLELLS